MQRAGRIVRWLAYTESLVALVLNAGALAALGSGAVSVIPSDAGTVIAAALWVVGTTAGAAWLGHMRVRFGERVRETFRDQIEINRIDGEALAELRQRVAELERKLDRRA